MNRSTKSVSKIIAKWAKTHEAVTKIVAFGCTHSEVLPPGSTLSLQIEIDSAYGEYENPFLSNHWAPEIKELLSFAVDVAVLQPGKHADMQKRSDYFVAYSKS